MDVLEKLRQWGLAHGAAREAERHATEQSASADVRQAARLLRERADRLHAEVYRELGGGRRQERPQG